MSCPGFAALQQSCFDGTSLKYCFDLCWQQKPSLPGCRGGPRVRTDRAKGLGLQGLGGAVGISGTLDTGAPALSPSRTCHPGDAPLHEASPCHHCHTAGLHVPGERPQLCLGVARWRWSDVGLGKQPLRLAWSLLALMGQGDSSGVSSRDSVEWTAPSSCPEARLQRLLGTGVRLGLG